MIEDDEEEAESESLHEEVNSGDFFCRFTPMQIDRFASAMLGEPPLCERWISRDGREAVLHGLRLRVAKRRQEDPPNMYVNDMVTRWKAKFEKTKK
jgi:hypothetical protein